MALNAQALITVEEAKELPDVSGIGSDTLIESALNAASLALESAMNGTVFVQQTFTEDYSGGINGRRGGAKRIHLYRKPIVSVTSILDDNSNEVTSTYYTIVAKQGFLEHDWRWPAPVGRWTIIYKAGLWATEADVDAAVKEACKLLVAERYRSRRPGIQSTSVGGRPGSKSVTKAVPRNPAGLPDDVWILVRKYWESTV